MLSFNAIIETFDKQFLVFLIPIFLVITTFFIPQVRQKFPKWFLTFVEKAEEIISSFGRSSESTGDKGLDKIMRIAGYAYDRKQDIFYSIMNPWQRAFGYCRLYDEAAAPMGMIIDCEPIYFDYGGKKWLIELWKGQYDLTTGCEIGIYTTEKFQAGISEEELFFTCADNSDRLEMSYGLKRYGKELFNRSGKHWWLTGFILGQYSEPWELSMEAHITLKNNDMLYAFVGGLKKAGYKDTDIAISGKSVTITFEKPHTSQPSTRTPEMDNIMQEKNRYLCEVYQELTKGYATIPEKINALHAEAPEIYQKAIKLGKSKELFLLGEDIKKYYESKDLS